MALANMARPVLLLLYPAPPRMRMLVLVKGRPAIYIDRLTRDKVTVF
jgi:hypothetical protein